MKQKEQDILGGVLSPEPGKSYKARNGLYYNGYALSNDAAEDYFGEAIKKICDEIQKDLDNWNKE